MRFYLSSEARATSYLILLAIVAGCSSGSVEESDINEIREAVFRYQFEHSGFDGFPTEVYFIAIGEDSQDPDEQFMLRFEGYHTPVKPRSQANRDVLPGVTDKDTGQAGLIFRVTKIEVKSGREAIVEGSIQHSGLAGSGHEYRVELQNGEWTVVEDKMTWVS